MSSNSLGLIHNACITLDETHAIDMTRDDPEHSTYFGISVPIDPLVRFCFKTDSAGNHWSRTLNTSETVTT
jgi:hypothetical protein